jgi:hypothetical protein
MGLEHRYLVILSCSQRKRSDPGLMPAIERYDGASFRVLRKAKREGYWPEHLDALILSAKYGLLEPEALIEDYDSRMTRDRAIALQPAVTADLNRRLAQLGYHEVFINLGQNYLIAIGEPAEVFNDLPVIYARGRIGERMRQLKMWLKAKAQE